MFDSTESRTIEVFHRPSAADHAKYRFSVHPGDVFSFCEKTEVPVQLQNGSTHHIFYYNLGGDSGWVMDYVKEIPQRRTIRIIVRTPFIVMCN